MAEELKQTLEKEHENALTTSRRLQASLQAEQDKLEGMRKEIEKEKGEARRVKVELEHLKVGNYKASPYLETAHFDVKLIFLFYVDDVYHQGGQD